MTRASLLRSLPLFMMALVPLACGGEQGGGEPQGAALSAQNYCVAFHEALCERQIGCNVALVNQATTVEACIAEAGRLCEPRLATWLDSLGAERTRFELDALQACRQEVAEARCRSLSAGFIPSVCRDIFVGDGIEGGECYTDVECRRGLICAASGRCPGSCAVPNQDPEAFDCVRAGCDEGSFCQDGRCRPQAQVGEACPDRNDACQAGLFCGASPDGLQTICQAPLESGALCQERTDCQSGQACVFADDANQRTCGAPRGDGEQCFDSQECPAGQVCAQGAGRCNTPRQEEETCFDASDCGEGLYCWFEFTDDPNTGVCREDAKVGIGQGQPCNPLVDRCRLGLYCRQGAVVGLGECVILPEVGERCADFTSNLNEECRAGSCVFLDGAPTCIEKGDAGAPCRGGEECLSNSCRDGACAAFDEVFCTVGQP